MSATSPKVYPAGFTPAYEDKDEEGKLINPYVSARFLVQEPKEHRPEHALGVKWQRDLDEEFWWKKLFHAQICFQPPTQVGLNQSVPEVAVLKMLAPTESHWKAIEVSFSLQPEASEGEAEPDLSGFQPLVLTEREAFFIHRPPLQIHDSLIYFVVKGFKYPMTGQFRVKFQIKVQAGLLLDMKRYSGDDLRWFQGAPEHPVAEHPVAEHPEAANPEGTPEHAAEAQNAEEAAAHPEEAPSHPETKHYEDKWFLAGTVVSEVVTEVKEGAEIVFADSQNNFEEFVKVEGFEQGLLRLAAGDMEKHHEAALEWEKQQQWKPEWKC